MSVLEEFNGDVVYGGPSENLPRGDVPFPSTSHDSVNHPAHYTVGDIEVIDYIRDKLTPTEFQGYCCGNVLKYVSRWRHKGGVQDLKKAQVYLNWAIESADYVCLEEETK